MKHPNTKAHPVSFIQQNPAQYLAKITYTCELTGKVKSFVMWTFTAQNIRDTYPTMAIIAIQREDNNY